MLGALTSTRRAECALLSRNLRPSGVLTGPMSCCIQYSALTERGLRVSTVASSNRGCKLRSDRDTCVCMYVCVCVCACKRLHVCVCVCVSEV